MEPGGPSRRIGLVVDHPLRDLDGLCLVAQLLTERGHEAVLLPFYTQHFDLPNLRLDALVLNYARPANLALAHAAAARGVALVVLDTEGGLIPETGPTSARGIADFLRRSGLDRQLALYLFWGPQLRELVVANSALPSERGLVTGCPRFDLAHAPYRADRQARDTHVLVNTNFPVVNPAHADASGGASRDDAAIDADALRSVGFAPDDIADLAQNVRDVMARMIETLGELARARPHRQFVLRPHPFERLTTYETAFAGFPNVRVERTGTAMEALAGADCLLHVNCTTAIEACLVGVPPISLDFINTQRLRAMAQLPGEISHSANGLAQTLALIDRAESLAPGRTMDRIAPLFGPLDGQAAQRVADALATAPLPRPAPDPSSASANASRARTAALLGRTLGSGVIEGLRILREPARRIKRFTAADVARRVTHFAALHGRDPAIIEQSHTALGLPIMAVTLRPPGLDSCPDGRRPGGHPLAAQDLRQPASLKEPTDHA